MVGIKYAKLAGWAAVLGMLALGEVQPPLRVRFHLADGIEVRGDLTTWDERSIDGSFGRRRWTELATDDVWRIYQRVMDQNSAQEWVALGGLLLQMTNGDAKAAAELAERAFKRARRLDEGIEPSIEQARRDAKAAVGEGEKEAGPKLGTDSPEAHPWPATPWPALTAAQHQAAAAEMRVEAEQILKSVEGPIEPLETDNFLLYSDFPRSDGARWIIQLEKACELARRVLWSGDEVDNRNAAPAGPFWGKAVVFVMRERTTFRDIEAEAFKHLVSQATVGVCHPRGPKVFINLHRHADESLFEWSMVHETVHGLMHRHGSPARLPAWANEGLAEYVAGIVLRDSPIAKANRKRGLEFIRGGGDVNTILDRQYADQSWLGQDANATAVASLLIELLVRDQPRRFVHWVNAVKAGEPWEDALREHLTSRSKLVDAFVQFYKVND